MGPPLQARLGDLRRGPGRSSLAGAHRRVRSTLALLPLMDMDAETSSHARSAPIDMLSRPELAKKLDAA